MTAATTDEARWRRFEPPKQSMGGVALRGGRLGLVSASVEQILSIGTTFILVRILAPKDFGIVAASNVVLAFLASMAQFGVAQAVIKRERVDTRVASTLWWASAAVGGAGTLLMLTGARWLARGFGIRVAGPYILVLAPVLLLRLTGAIPRALLQRQLKFRAVYVADMVVAVIYAGLQIGLALAGAGAYAVVFGQLGSAVALLVISHAFVGWVPTFAFDRQVLREERRFTAGVFSNTSISWVNKNLDYWAVGRVGDARRLGIYYVAYVLPNILRQRLTWTTTEVLFPVLTRIRDDLERFRAAYLRMLQLMAFAGFPLMTGITLLAPWVVRIAFGPEWRSARGPMRILAIAALIEFTTQAVTTLFLADGQPGKNARIQVVRFASLVPGVAAGAVYGSIAGIAGGVLASTIVAAVYSQVLVCRRLEMSMLTPIRALVPVLVPTLAMVVTVLAVDLSVNPTAVVEASSLMVIGAATFFAVGQGLFPQTFKQLLLEAQRLVRGRV